jgi:hypothetical protein
VEGMLADVMLFIMRVNCHTMTAILWIFFDIFLRDGNLSPDYPQNGMFNLVAMSELR